MAARKIKDGATDDAGADAPVASAGLALLITSEASRAAAERRWAASGVLHAADQRIQELALILPEVVEAADGDLRAKLEALQALL